MTYRVFWADTLADEVIERYGKEGEVVVKCAASPSGGKHIGNINDILRGYFIKESLKSMGVKTRHVHTSDDRDPLRKIPERMPDRDGKWHILSEKELNELNKYAGIPYVDVPDPFGCCKSWAEHFNNVWLDGVNMLGVEVEDYSNDQLYREGKFEPPMRTILSDIPKAKEVISKYQRNTPPDYIPFNPICEKCGRITAKAVSVDLDNWTVDYICESKSLAGEFDIPGCGHKGTTSLNNGKLPWRFEWPSQWQIFDVKMEPFGKDHYEGSWPSGQEISKVILGREPPVYTVYEFFLVNSAKMSTRHGNVYITQDMAEIMEPEVFLYFYSLNPMKQKNLEVKNINFLVDGFDRFERVYYDEVEAADPEEKDFAKRVYPMLPMEDRRKIRIPYTFAAMVSVSKNDEHILRTLRKTGHLPQDATPEQETDALKRVHKAGIWARKYAPDEYNIDIKEALDLPPEMEPAEKDALAEIADFIEARHTEEETQYEIFEIAKRKDIKPAKLFKTAYLLLLGKPRGPKLGPFLLALDTDFVLKRLRLEA
ncbi:lysine--tRNA ligase [Methanocella sp. CWC-04]|uniref:Lysine--tRNA ligase n=1 Tax=Methanooceanicella nereidis TaxID=2052831 RepID=A0AAP2REL7_9EURY|nr:lysine--tRNA ligase [Methanocella sp. CWC-04]MCD1295371.1 lysine--tRNA ligase [Methanocella sp. CWC-04]